KMTALCLTTITILSTLVYGHHMYTTQMSPLLTQSFMTLTMLISIPSAIFFANWLGTIWKGSIRFDSPMLFSLGVVFVFVIGGLAGIYFWFPKMFGVMLSERLAKWHFWCTMIPLNGVFTGMMIAGYAGMHRRLYNPFVYEFLGKLVPINTFITYSAIAMGLAQFIFLYSFFKGIFGKNNEPAEANPWGVGTLEWEIPSPAPYYNFKEVPVVKCGPHEFGNPNLNNGRDFQ